MDRSTLDPDGFYPSTIWEIPDSIGDHNATAIWIHISRFWHLPAAVAKMPRLKKILITNTNLDIAPEIFQSNVTQLHVDESRLSYLDDLVKWVALRKLSLVNCGLSTLPTLELPNLVQLDLSENLIEKVPPGLSQLKHLRSVDFSHNKLRKLGDRLPNLVELFLDHNPIERLPRWLKSCQLEQITADCALVNTNLRQAVLIDCPQLSCQTLSYTKADMFYFSGLPEIAYINLTGPDFPDRNRKINTLL